MRPVVLALCVTAGAAAAAAQGRPAPVPAPLGAWTPVPALPGMGRPVDTAAVAARRRALLARIGHGVVLIPAAHERDVERDYIQDNDFRQNNTFFYFTELETQDAWLLMIAGGASARSTCRSIRRHATRSASAPSRSGDATCATSARSWTRCGS